MDASVPGIICKQPHPAKEGVYFLPGVSFYWNTFPRNVPLFSTRSYWLQEEAETATIWQFVREKWTQLVRNKGGLRRGMIAGWTSNICHFPPILVWVSLFPVHLVSPWLLLPSTFNLVCVPPIFIKVVLGPGTVAHLCNPRYLGCGDQEDHGGMLASSKNVRPYLTANRTGVYTSRDRTVA
jgi:hypothetical protein